MTGISSYRLCRGPMVLLGALLIAAFLLFIPAEQAYAADPPEADALPGYYEFFMKTGRLVRITQEVERDDRIAAGELQPVRVKTQLPDMTFPLASGEQIRLHDYKGRKNLVIVSFRSWW